MLPLSAITLCLLAPLQDAPDRPGLQDPEIWFDRLQQESGAWAGDASVGEIGVTALTLLAGVSDGATRTRGPWHETVAKGADWLVAQIDAKSGCFGAADRTALGRGRALLDHAWATLAVSELLVLGGEWKPGSEAPSVSARPDSSIRITIVAFLPQ